MIEVFTKSDGNEDDLKQAFSNKHGARARRRLEKKKEAEQGEKDLSSLAGLVYPSWARPGSALAAPNKQPK
jgi:hypothetical protein